MWDFEKNRVTDRRADDCRRTLFMIGGGALADRNRGTVVPEAEIIDFAPTVAHCLDIELKTDGKPVLTGTV